MNLHSEKLCLYGAFKYNTNSFDGMGILWWKSALCGTETERQQSLVRNSCRDLSKRDAFSKLHSNQS